MGRVNVEKFPVGWQQKKKYESINQMLNIFNITSRDDQIQRKRESKTTEKVSVQVPNLAKVYVSELVLVVLSCVHKLTLSPLNIILPSAFSSIYWLFSPSEVYP